MLLTVLLIAAAAILVLVIVIAMRPSEFRVSRSQRIAAPAERVFAEVADFRRWAGWSPWEGLDPKAVKTFSASSSGVGATYHWSGDKRVGEGEMAITEVRPGQHLGIAISFIRPFAARNTVAFDFTAEGGATTVSWTMSGRASFMFKAMGLFVDCDAMIGKQFAQGLSQLQATCEKAA